MENEMNLKPEATNETQAEKDLARLRNFLRGLGKWSLSVIGGVALGTVAAPSEAKGRVNARGRWMNRTGVTGWTNRTGSWVKGGGNWINRGGGRLNGGWVNGRGN